MSSTLLPMLPRSPGALAQQQGGERRAHVDEVARRLQVAEDGEVELGEVDLAVARDVEGVEQELRLRAVERAHERHDPAHELVERELPARVRVAGEEDAVQRAQAVAHAQVRVRARRVARRELHHGGENRQS